MPWKRNSNCSPSSAGRVGAPGVNEIVPLWQPCPKHASAAVQEERLQDLRYRSQVPFDADDSDHMVSHFKASRLPNNLQEAKAA